MTDYQIIDVSNWEKFTMFAKGSKNKDILINPATNKQVIFKEPAPGSGDVWSEKIASEIGKALGFNVHYTDIAMLDGVYGSLVYLSLDIDKGESLVEGAWLFKQTDPEFNEYKRVGYNLQRVMKILDYDKCLIIDFLQMIVFDIFIGNTDRHSENWGIIQGLDNTKLAAAYDNSSSLGREFHSNIEKLKERLKNEELFLQYCHSRKGSYMIGWENNYKIPHLEYLQYIYNEFPEIVRKHVESLERLTEERIYEIVFSVPDVVMNEYCKKFVVKFLVYRKNYIINYIKD